MNNMKRKLYFILITMMAFILVIAGCSSDDSYESKKNKKSEKPASYASDLRIAVSSNPTSLDPHMTTAADTSEMLRNIFETLVALDEDYEPQPMLAESIDVNDDGLTYTFNLREEIYFHNGEEMVAGDVEASMQRWLESSSQAQSLLKGAEFVSVDPYTIEMHLDERASDALDLLATTSQFPAIMPKEVIDEATKEGVQEYSGTGPFEFEELKQDSYLHLIKYEEIERAHV